MFLSEPVTNVVRALRCSLVLWSMSDDTEMRVSMKNGWNEVAQTVWPLCSRNPDPLNFSLWGCLKSLVHLSLANDLANLTVVNNCRTVANGAGKTLKMYPLRLMCTYCAKGTKNVKETTRWCVELYFVNKVLDKTRREIRLTNIASQNSVLLSLHRNWC